MLHAAETWPLNTTDLHRLQRNDRAMIRWICKVKPEDTALVRSASLLTKLGLDGLEVVLREKRLRWFGDVQRAPGAIKSVTELVVEGRRGRGRPKMTWKETTRRDRGEWKLLHVDPLDRKAWRTGVKTARRGASQLPGQAPTDVDDVPTSPR